MASIDELLSATRDFFKKHWNPASAFDPPQFSDPWRFRGTVPGNDRKGCYALVRESEVVYVGVALNRGREGYNGHSLGSRITTYWLVDRSAEKVDGHTTYRPSPRIKEWAVDAIYTLPFPDDDQEYLAIALEYFLIRKLLPEKNKIYRSHEAGQKLVSVIP